MKIDLRKGYIEQRKAAYPSVVDQLDILYHEGFDAWKEKIDGIKAQYPKTKPLELD